MISAPTIWQRFEVAQVIARQAGSLIKKRFFDPDSFTLSFKENNDCVTDTDLEVEAFIVQRLVDAFHGDSFMCEENGGSFSPSLWVIDPIDGTANFARGIPHFCISIAYLDEGRPVIGVIFDPITDEMFAGLDGFGATLNGSPLQVSSTSDVRLAQIEIGLSAHTGIVSPLALGECVLTLGAGLIIAGSGALGLAYVAAGRLDAFCEQHIKAWDVLAGIVLVAEAGGYASNFLADDGLTRGNPVLACTPGLRDVLTRATRVGL